MRNDSLVKETRQISSAKILQIVYIERVILQWENRQILLSQVIKVNCKVIHHLIQFTLNIMWWEWCWLLVIFLPQTQALYLIIRKKNWTPDKRDLLQATRPLFLKTTKTFENKENLRKCQSREEPKDTCQLKAMWSWNRKRLVRN